MSGYDIKTIEGIVLAAKRHGLTAVRIRQGDVSLRLELPADALSNPEVLIRAEAPGTDPPATNVVVRSTMVGFFRSAPSGVEEGTQVAPDTVIGIIEALGLPNEIPAGLVGTLDELLVEDGQPVEYGQAIARIRP
jgi:acetyl-CoA carboxylase biotin carboxyl carrier protein